MFPRLIQAPVLHGELPLVCSVILTCRTSSGPHVKREWSSVSFPSHPRQKPPARALGPSHHWRHYPKFRGSTHSILACLLLLRGSKKPSLNCKSGLIVPYATNSQYSAALPEGEELVWFTPTLWKRGRGYFRGDVAVDSIGLQSTSAAGLSFTPFSLSPIIFFSSADVGAVPRAQLFPGYFML